MKVLILNYPLEDWKGVYKDGVKIAEFHNSGIKSDELILRCANDFGFTYRDVSINTVAFDDTITLNHQKKFPDLLTELTGSY